MGKRNKLWASMRVVTFASVAALVGCSGEAEDEAGQQGAVQASSMQQTLIGERAGESEGSSSAVVLDDLAYLTQLSLIRGHLLVGYQLYQAGHSEHAKTHMKHPESELYGDLAPALAARGGSGFADELEALATAVATNQAPALVTDVYGQLDQAITAHEVLASQSTANRLQRVVGLLRIAGEEYGIAVVDGKMQNAHEYQDAYGFTQVAKALLSNAQQTEATVTSIEAAAIIEKAQSILEGLDNLWPSLIPPDELATEAGQLYGAAAQIEFLALGIE